MNGGSSTTFSRMSTASACGDAEHELPHRKDGSWRSADRWVYLRLTGLRASHLPRIRIRVRHSRPEAWASPRWLVNASRRA